MGHKLLAITSGIRCNAIRLINQDSFEIDFVFLNTSREIHREIHPK